MKRIILSIVVLLAVLNASSLYVGATVQRATPSPAKPVPVGPLLQPFVAPELPAGRMIGVPQHTRTPAGFTLKHKHPGNRYVFIISGSEEITDAQGTRTYSAGMFFWEQAWHVHTIHVLSDVETFTLTFIPPGGMLQTTIPVQ
jgi:quercetin dioxygenase-like cupin family protein